MKSILTGLVVLGLLGMAGVAGATTIGGKVIYVDACATSTNSTQWGVIVVKNTSGMWETVWVDGGIPEETARRILRLAGRATGTHVLTFTDATENNAHPWTFWATSRTIVTLRRAAPPQAAATWGPDRMEGQINKIVVDGRSALIYVGKGTSNWVGVATGSAHLAAVFSTAVDGFDDDHNTTFTSLTIVDSTLGNFVSGRETGVQSFKARNQ